ncbi:Hypothetical protein ABZS17G119_02291 [Kosakonia cowanii]
MPDLPQTVLTQGKEKGGNIPPFLSSEARENYFQHTRQ